MLSVLTPRYIEGDRAHHAFRERQNYEDRFTVHAVFIGEHLHDAEVGIAWLPGPRPYLDRLADSLRSLSSGLVGVSPLYDDLRHTAGNLRLAIGIESKPGDQQQQAGVRPKIDIACRARR